LVNISVFKSSNSKSEQLSTIEAFNIWNILRSRYISIETYQFLRNFIHDRDFILIANNHLDDFQSQVATLEALGKHFKLQVPTRPPAQIKISTQLEAITDKFVHRKFFSDLISELKILSDALTTSTTNDRLRKHLSSFVLDHLKNYEELYKFGKLKGWTDIEPAFTSGKPTKKEPIAVSEAYHLWEHLNYRYDQLELTNLYLNFVHDADFRAILQGGLSSLNSQIKILEKESTKFEVPLPERPPASMSVTIDPEIMTDKSAYRTIFTGMQSATSLHTRAVIDTIRNDPLRTVFFDFLKEELNFYDKLVKYGKVKGWLHIVPTFRNMA